MSNPFIIGLKACFILAVGMGFGRFAFTVLYPYMVNEQLLTITEGSTAASINYAGYLIGALFAIRSKAHHAHLLCLYAIIGTVICLLLLALPLSSLWIIIIRGVSGVFSALAIIGSSLWLFNQKGLIQQAPLLYAGVGIGIALSAEIVVIGNHLQLTSTNLWLILSIIGFLVFLFVVQDLRQTAKPHQIPSAKTDFILPSLHAKPLVIMYGLAGFGYIITATYLPLSIQLILPNLNIGHIWAAFGLAAAPSCFLWQKLHYKLGSRQALILNLWLQAIGVSLPVIFPTATGYLLSALLVGGSFMGTVTLAMAQAQLITRQIGTNLIAVMTVAYSVGQIIGPLVADQLYKIQQNFEFSLLCASIALLAGSIMIIADKHKMKSSQ